MCVFIHVRACMSMSELVCGGQRSMAYSASQVLSVLLLDKELGDREPGVC